MGLRVNFFCCRGLHKLFLLPAAGRGALRGMGICLVAGTCLVFGTLAFLPLAQASESVQTLASLGGSESLGSVETVGSVETSASLGQALADCPSLAGLYICEVGGGELEVREILEETDAEGFMIYTVKRGFEPYVVRADGMEHVFVESDPETGATMRIVEKAYCDRGKLRTEFRMAVANDPEMTSTYMTWNWDVSMGADPRGLTLTYHTRQWIQMPDQEEPVITETQDYEVCPPL